MESVNYFDSKDNAIESQITKLILASLLSNKDKLSELIGKIKVIKKDDEGNEIEDEAQK